MNEEEEVSKSGFTVVDKRGANNPIKEKPAPIEPEIDTRPVVDRQWTSIGYWIVPVPQQGGDIILIGKAHGKANDASKNIFVVDYLIDQRSDEGYAWTLDAKRRLDTFLQCPCDMKTGSCAYHKRMASGGWLREDTQRLRESGDRPLPEVLEILFKAERDRQQAQRILAPRR